MLFNKNHTQHTEYVQALEEERRKIQVFERELPLCLELVTQAIETCRQQMSGTTTECLRGQSEYSEETSSEVPILEEFIPIKRNFSFEDDGKKNEKEGLSICNNNDNNNKKSDWLRSVQLWNQTPDPPIKEDSPTKMPVMEVKRNGSGAFHPFKRDKSVVTPPAPPPPATAPAAASSSAETGGHSGGGSKGEDKGGESLRKSRRCWSPELHKRFLHALQQLGGCHVATPKQIRELMKVDGLTNDEVKSHLQKYRLHTRRPSPTIHNNNQQQPQFVVVGGIWVPPREYAAMATTTASEEASMRSTPDGIYAPRASLPPSLPSSSASPNQNQQQNQFHSDERRSNSDAGVHCNSPASSSSTHTTTASTVF